MSNWHNDNWSGNDLSPDYPVGAIPRPVRRVIWFSFRFYLLVVCLGAFLWGTYAAVQAVRRLSARSQLHQSAPTAQHRHTSSTKGVRP